MPERARTVQKHRGREEVPSRRSRCGWCPVGAMGAVVLWGSSAFAMKLFCFCLLGRLYFFDEIYFPALEPGLDLELFRGMEGRASDAV